MMDASSADVVTTMAHCAYKMTAILTRETKELTGLDLWPPNRTTFQTSVVTCCCAISLTCVNQT